MKSKSVNRKSRQDVKIKFKIWDCYPVCREFVNGGKRIDLKEIGTHESIATCNVWIEGLEKDEIAVKNYSENTGMLSCLVKAGIVELPYRSVPSGWVDLYICKLTELGKLI